jgi:two-component system sensor kinase FixL
VRATRLEMLLDGLLAYSRIGRIHRSALDVDISEMVRNVVEMLAPSPGFVIAYHGTMAMIYTHRVSIQVVLQYFDQQRD